MPEILNKENINTGRQYHIDLLKALSIVAMVLCHTVMRFAAHRNGYLTEFGYLLGDAWLGCYVGVAHAFMFSMGVGFVFSHQTTPESLLKRGIQTYFLGYVLNFFRFGIYAILDLYFKLNYSPELLSAFLFQDIFQFAGLAMILTSLLKKRNLNEISILTVGIGLSILESLIPNIQTHNLLFDLIIGSFVSAAQLPSHFTLLNWYIFVAAGMLFAQIIRRLTNQDAFYKKLMIISGILAAVFLFATVKLGMFFGNALHRYYSVSIVEAAGYLSIDFFLLSIFYFAVKRFGTEHMNVFLNMSKNLTGIYVIHWGMIGFLDYVLCYRMKLVFSYSVIYLLGFIILIAAYIISNRWNNRTMNNN